MASFLAVILFFFPLSSQAADYIAHCPKETRSVRTLDPRHPWACVSTEEKYQSGMECPPGYQQVTTAERYDPFKCALSGVFLLEPEGVCPSGFRAAPTADPDKKYECQKIEKDFFPRPACPKGTRPVPTPGAVAPFRCEKSFASDPEPLPGRGGEGKVEEARPPPLDPADYRRYEVPGQFRFDYPGTWRVADSQVEQEPSITILLDTGRDGKQVSLSVARKLKTSPSYQAMESMIWRDKNLQGGKKTSHQVVAGHSATIILVRKEFETAYIAMPDGYLALSFSAPADLFMRYLPAYKRLLSTFAILEK